MSTKQKRNPRRASGWTRDKLRAQIKKEGRACWICGGPINYDAPRYITTPGGKRIYNPWYFTLDERIPVSRYWEGNYPSPQACALDYSNLEAAHLICNQRRGNKPVNIIRNKLKTENSSLPTKKPKHSRNWSDG